MSNRELLDAVDLGLHMAHMSGAEGEACGCAACSKGRGGKRKWPSPAAVDKTVQKGNRALQELDLSVTTQADKARVSLVWAALHALDNEQARVKTLLDDARAKAGGA